MTLKERIPVTGSPVSSQEGLIDQFECGDVYQSQIG